MIWILTIPKQMCMSVEKVPYFKPQIILNILIMVPFSQQAQQYLLQEVAWLQPLGSLTLM